VSSPAAAPIARPESVHETLELMRAMGAESYDPTPPEQLLWPLDPEAQPLSHNGQIAHAWLFQKTVHPHAPGRPAKRSWKRTGWGQDERGDLAIRHMAADCFGRA
jgi:hypothetical protein